MNESRPIYNRKKRWYDGLSGYMGKLAKWGAVLVLLGLVGVVCFASFYGWRASQYDMAEVKFHPAGTQVYYDDGQSMGSPFGRDRIVIRYDQLPQHFIEALLAREDESFASHNGIDFSAIVRSILRNTKDMSYTQGGSTITMQLARNVYELGRQRTLDRKFLEMAIAMKIEGTYSKGEILESYLNRIYFGAGAYGVGDAARIYFGKQVSELGVGEGAMLAGIIRGPSKYNPFANEKLAVAQRNETLDRMVDAGYLEAETAARVKGETLVLSANNTNFQASYPLRWIKREIESLFAPGDGEEFVEEEDLGVYIQSSFHLPLQRHVERTVETTLRELEASEGWPLPPRSEDSVHCIQAAVMAVKPNTGFIQALVGGRDPMAGKEIWGELELPMGVLFSPVIYAAASEASQFIVEGDPFETAKKLKREDIVKMAGNAGITGDLPKGEILAGGLFSRRVMDSIPLLLTFYNGGYRPELHSIRSAVTPKGNILHVSPFLKKREWREPDIAPDVARIVYGLSPFAVKKKSSLPIKRVRAPYIGSRGVFFALIHKDISVFVWLGQEPIKGDALKNPKFVTNLMDAADLLATRILGFVVPLPLEEVSEPQKPARNSRR